MGSAEPHLVEVTFTLPEDLASRLAPMGPWLPAIIELGLLGFTTVASATASEVIAYLSANPSRQDVLSYHVSERAQARLRRLLALNQAGELGPEEQRELDELARIEHILVMLKASLVGQ